MSLFTYYAILLTVVYVLYYIVLIAMDKYGKPKDAEANVETVDTSDMVEKSGEEEQSSESHDDAEEDDEASRPMDGEEDNPPYPSIGQEDYHQEDESTDTDSPSDAESPEEEIPAAPDVQDTETESEVYSSTEQSEAEQSETESETEQYNKVDSEDASTDIEEDAPQENPELNSPEEHIEQSSDDTPPETPDDDSKLNDRIMQMYKDRGITTFEGASQAEELDLDVNDNEAHTVVHEPDNTLPQEAADIAQLHMDEIDAHSPDEEFSSSFAKRLKENRLSKDSNIISHDEVLTP